MNNKIICALLVGAMIITMLYLCKKGDSAIQQNVTKTNNFQPGSGNINVVPQPTVSTVQQNMKPTLVFFRVKGCPHCDNMLGVWGNASQILKEGGVTTHDIEMNDQPEIFQKARSVLPEFGGVPDIRFFPHGFNFGDPQKVVKYSGDRSEESIVGFAYGNLPKELS